jgi:sugar phosphate isomerase/epimerase
MKIAINTGSLSFDTPTAVAQAKGLGFTTLEVNLQQAELRYDFQRNSDTAFYTTLAQEIRIRGMSVGSVHNLLLNAAQAFSQGARREVLELSARVTAQLGARVLVVHPADLFVSEEALSAYLSSAPKKRRALPLVTGFEQVRDVLDELGVCLALENVSYWHDTLLTNQAEYMAVLVEALDCRVALDVRCSLLQPNLQRWIELVGDRIAILHIHDEQDGNEHHPPLDPAWGERIALLKQTPAEVCVIEAHATPIAHAGIRASRDYIARLWGEG